MTTKTRVSITAALALAVSASAAALGHPVIGAQAHTVAGYLTAALGAGLAAMHGPAVVKKITPTKKPTPPAALKLPAFGLDWSYGTLPPWRLQQLGVKFACRYLSWDPAKNLTRPEAQRLHKAGIKIVLIWETTANRALDGMAAGVADGLAAVRMAAALGIEDTPIYFAIDFDATGPDVAQYFHGASTATGDRAGAYGGYTALNHLFSAGLIRYGWQTYAWSAGRWHPKANLLQYSNDHTVFGVGVDFDHAVTEDFGCW